MMKKDKTKEKKQIMKGCEEKNQRKRLKKREFG